MDSNPLNVEAAKELLIIARNIDHRSVSNRGWVETPGHHRLYAGGGLVFAYVTHYPSLRAASPRAAGG